MSPAHEHTQYPEQETSRTGLEIAVIGMAGRFPSATSVSQFWQLLQAGQEGLSVLSDAELSAAGVPSTTFTQAEYVKKRGFISRKRELDAELLGYTASDAAGIDPQFGVFHEVAWEALENAGYHSSKFAGLIGIYAGASNNLAWLRRIMEASGSMADYFHAASLTDAGYLATRVAHKLDLTGPAITSNTTCSTSLVNIHQACQSLNAGDCDIALAGGVSISALENKGYLYQENMILSPDGSCRPFDAQANGTASGEGCAVVVLKRLEDAILDRDNIVAVIKGSAINNDGQQKSGYTAPSVAGQAAVINSALQRAELQAQDLSYIETHGTATKLGDPIEISALKKVFSGAPDSHCLLGSVKSNIGHLGEAAGVAGAIKVILSLQHQQLPASLHFQQANPLLGLADTPFEINQRLQAWPSKDGQARRAGVSSFGIGGTNAHVIFEEFTETLASGPSRSANLLCLSANTAQALQTLEQNLSAYAAQHPHVQLADICYTLHLGRKDLRYRSAWLAHSTAELAQGLPSTVQRGEVKLQAKLCMMFPGQGAQYVDMGRELYQQEALFQEILDAGFAHAQQCAGLDLRALMFANAANATPLLATAAAQPALFLLEYALAKLLQSWGCKPDAYLGHSVGEYVAACLAGVWSFEDALAIVIERGRLMQSLPSGAMLAVSLTTTQIAPYLHDKLSLAAVNSPQRLVVAGTEEDIQALMQQLQAQQIEHVLLHTSHAFHSWQQEAILAEFGAFLAKFSFSAPHTAFLSNLSGTWITPQQATSSSYWCQHLRGTVRFSDCLLTLCAEQAQVLLEVGPGTSLSTFARQHTSTPHSKTSIALLPSAKNRVAGQDWATFLQALGQLYAAGIALDWAAFYQNETRRRLALPSYPFADKCFYPASLLQAAPSLALASSTPHSSVADTTAMAVAVATSTKVEHATQQSMQEASDDSTATRLRLIWQQYLGVEKIDPNEDLFNLGVDSLLSIRVITEIRKTFNTELGLDKIFQLRSVAEQAAEIDRKLSNASGEPQDAALPALRAYPHAQWMPLSTSQKRLWIITQLESTHTAYNTGFCHFVKHVDLGILQRVFQVLVQRHSILRTTYAEIDGIPMQHIHPASEFTITERDISMVAPADRYKVGEKIWQQALLDPIDLKCDVMLRASVVKYDADTHLLMVTQHHICSDNWSTNLVMDEMSTLYAAFVEGRDDPLPALPLQYIDYVLWQNEWLNNAALSQQIAFWKQNLAGIPQVHNLPLDRPRPKYQSYLGTQYMSKLAPSVLDGLNQLGRQHGTTLFMTMQAAFAALMARYSGETDIVVGFPVANRLHKEVEAMIGFFVNTLVLRSNLAGDPDFVQLLAQTKKNLVAAYANAHLPFETLVNELKPERSLSYEPIVQVQLVFLDQSQEMGGRVMAREHAPEGLHMDIEHADMQVPFSKYDLTLYFNVVDGGISLAWEYASDLFDAATIQHMAANFDSLLRAILAQPTQKIQHLPLLAPEQMRKQLCDWNRDGGRLYAQMQKEAEAKTAANTAPSASADAFAFSLFYFASDDGSKSQDKYRLLLEGAKFADQNGFQAVWTPERHFDSFGGIYPNPAITAAALAAMTTNIHLRAGSCVLPLHNPVRVAEDWSVIDNISGGRVGIGFAAGFTPRDFTLAPNKFEERREHLIRDVQTVKALWRGESVTLPNGKGELAQVSIRPRPVQDELPVWVTTTGNEEAFRHAGRMGDNILTHLMGQSLAELKEKIALYRAARAEAGHAGPGTVTMLVHTFIAEREELIFSDVKEPFKKYLVDSVGTPQAIAKSLGVQDGALSGDGTQNNDIDAITEFAFHRYYQSNAMLGTPERCLPVAQAIRAAGVNEIACLIDFGVNADLVLDNLQHLKRLRDMVILPAPASLPALPAMELEQEQAQEQTLAPTSALCLHHLFEQRASMQPDAIAVQFEGQQLSYGELNAKANQLAHYLQQTRQLAPEQTVGLCLERSPAMVVAMLAVLKSGAAYVPIEASTPLARIQLIAQDAGCALLLADQQTAAHLPSSSTLVLDQHGGFAEANNYATSNPSSAVQPDNLAYVIYTSGSTGQPKGVAVEHQQIVRLFSSSAELFELNTRDTWFQFHSYAFDVSVWEIWGALQSGARLLLAPKTLLQNMKALHQLLVKEKVSVLCQTPSAFYTLQAVLPTTDHQLALRYVILAGEALQPKNLARWFDANGQLLATSPKLINMYGPTETTVYATYKEITAQDVASNKSNIGRGLPDLTLCVLNAAGQMQPIGVAGQLYVGGKGVARGYWQRPELSAEKFVPHPMLANSDERWYSTGDLVRYLPNGEIEYLARIDNQVKVRGFRIELGEIESHLLAHPQVAEAVVLAVGEGSEKYLAAYIVPKDIAANATASATAVLPFDEAKLIADLKRELMANLPLYMVPQAFACMASLPLNTNSKLDRNMLSKNFLVQQNMVQFVAPRTETEEVLLAIWQEMLGREEISVTANFFEIGGQSLVAIRIGNEIARRFALEIETRYLFEYVTIEALAAYIEVMQEQTKQVLDSSSSTTSANDADEDVEIEF